LADICTKYLKKGSQVYLEGAIQTRTWETDEGEKRYATDIKAMKVEFLGAAAAPSQEATASTGPVNPGVPNHAPGASNTPAFDSDESIPF
jgi:single-strand DNA-binding protein